MLGLATHEPYFTILREDFKPNQPRPCEICNQYGRPLCMHSPSPTVDIVIMYWYMYMYMRIYGCDVMYVYVYVHVFLGNMYIYMYTITNIITIYFVGHSMTECTGEAREKKGEVISLSLSLSLSLFIIIPLSFSIHVFMYCIMFLLPSSLQFDELATANIAMEKEFIFIRINVLREVSLTLLVYLLFFKFIYF